MKKNNKKETRLIVILVIIIILIIAVNIALSKKSSNNNVATEEELIEAAEDIKISKLANYSEKQRMEYYATEFIRNIENANYEDAYKVLNNDFKNSYFPTQDAFENYCKEYFSDEIITNYSNIERLNNTYVLWVDVKDGNGRIDDFSTNIVVKENGYHDYELSFSVNTAVEANH